MVSAVVPVELLPRGVSVNQDGTKVCVTNEVSDTVSVIDTATNTVTDTVKVGRGPVGVAFGPFTASNANSQSAGTNSTKTIPAGFNFLILTAMIVLYIWRKST
jgi:YVTN family beta-propeller protein